MEEYVKKNIKVSRNKQSWGGRQERKHTINVIFSFVF